MSIRKKTLLAISFIFLLLFIYSTIITYNLLINGFNNVENNDVHQNVSRVNEALNAKIDELGTKLYDWSQWDDTYVFMQNHNKKYVESNLTDETFSALKINMIIFIDTKGNVVYSKNYNLDTLSIESVPAELLQYLTKDSLLLQHKDPASVIKGLIKLPQKNLIVASRPIVTSTGDGPIRGTLIFGRYFDEAYQKNISSVTNLPIDFMNIDGYLSQDLRNIQYKIASSDSIQIVPIDSNTIAGYTVFNDIFHKPILLLKVTFPRPIHQQGLTSVFYFFFLYGTVFFIFSLVVLYLLNRIVISRLYQLSAELTKVRSEEDLSKRISFQGHDELSMLAHEINSMLSNLEKSNEEIKKDEQKIEDEAQELEHKNTRLEKSEEALINIMDDLEETKNKIEQEKIRDETMLESIGEGLIVTDRNGTTMIVNKAAQNMLEYEADEIIGQKMSEAIDISDKNGQKISPQNDIIHAVLESGKKSSAVYYFKRKDGTTFPATVTTTAFMLEGKIIGVISVLHDITKEMEVDRMKTEFISLASHQLRTPLSATKCFSEMMMEEKAHLSTDQMDYLKSIHESNERMIDLVDSLLNISRIESGRIIVDPKPTQLTPFIKDILKELEVKMKEKNIKVNIEVSPDVPVVKVDNKMVRHVFINILTNALKYSPENSEVSVSISVNGPDILTKIKDQGYGIPKKDFPKVFQKFFRAENVLNKVTDGTGLGLYLVKSIIESSGGKIWFESEENKGSTFYFTLPIDGVPPKPGEVSLTS
jgi:PAS domain S-box-containing protein